MNSVNNKYFITLFDRNFGMRITIGARFSAGKAVPPLVDSVLDVKMAGFVKIEDIVFIFPFCPLARNRKQINSQDKLILRLVFIFYF